MERIQITERLSPNFNVGRQRWTPDIIVCHITDGLFPGSVNWVQNPASQVSYHYMVSQSGELFRCVDIKNTAWANGTANSGGNNDNRHSLLAAVRDRGVNANLYTVSIGFEGRHLYTRGALSPKQLDAAVRLIGHIQAEVFRIWGQEIPADREHIIGHTDIAPRWRPNCPGVKFPFDEIIQQAQAAAEWADMSKTSKFNPGHIPDTWAADAWVWAMNDLRMDGTRPRDNLTRQEAMTLLYRLHKLQAGPEGLRCGIS